jgi:Phosphate-selective porin O and P
MTPILTLNQGSFHFMSISDCILQHVLMSSSGQASRFQRKFTSANVQRGGRSTSTLLIASLMLGVSSAAVLAGDDSSSKSKAEQATKKSAAEEGTNKTLMKKLEAMERRMQSLETELKEKEKEAQASLMARRRLGGLFNAQASDLSSPNKNNNDLFGVAPSPVPGLKIGMYGEIKFGSQQNPAAGGQWQNGFDMARLVLLPTYQVTDNIVFNAEIEFEHAGSGFDNDDKLHGTAEVEQAFFDFRFNDNFILRSPGVDIVPISFNNLYHEPTLFYSVERPELANGLIPSTWVAPSAGFYGKIVDGLNYQFQVSQSAEDYGDDFAHRGANGAPVPGGYAAGVEGMDALGFAHAPLGSFAQLNNTAAYTFRLSYQPSFIPGFAGSSAVYYSPDITPRGAYADDLLADGTNRPLGKNAMTIFDTEARYRMPNTGLELRAEYAYVNFSNPENLRANNDTDPTNNVGKDMWGYSGEIAYHVKMGTILGSEWEAVPFYRYTHQNLQTAGMFGSDDPNGLTGSGDQTFHDVGVAVFPNPSLVLKLNYTKKLDHSATGPQSDRIVGGVGWLW